MALPADITRRYEITSVLGQGGFGTVYRATLKGTGGFTRDVAIKLLKDPNPPAEVLERFRDEARVLGLIRDRAVVHVEPPVKLSDRWAVVMEYVDGASLSRVLRASGAMPPEIALEITAEIARALHRLWNQPGPDGQPLHLRHRDLKPGNIQITPDGTVVLLDFGIAKATFESREARTATGIVGTEGFIAPERFFGTEGPTTDVFSLGVVLHEMLTGKRPTPGKQPEPTTGLSMDAVTLALRMCSLDPSQRPEPRDVERSCTDLLRISGKHGRLREWAEVAIPAASRLPPDALVGEVLTEAATMSVAGSSPVRPLGLALFAGGTTALFVSLVGVVGLGGIVLLGAVAWVATRPPPALVSAEPVEAPDPEPPSVEPASAAEPAVEAAPVPSIEPVAVTPSPSRRPPERAPKPAVAPAPVPVVEPAAPAEAATPAVTVAVSFGSAPPDADVSIDGKPIGTTPVVGHALSAGTHTVTMTVDGRSVTKTITVDRRAPTRYFWRSESGGWEGSR